MDDVKNLLRVMELLDNSWVEITSDLTDENLSYLENELDNFKEKIKLSNSKEEINETARDFYQIFSNFKYIKDISEADFPDVRGATLPEPEDEVKIKILNFCEILRNRIHPLKNDKK